MRKTKRGRYTLEFKQKAVRPVEPGQSIAEAARTLEVVEQTLSNWVKANCEGKLKQVSGKTGVMVVPMEIGRLHAELARVTGSLRLLSLLGVQRSKLRTTHFLI
jgi:transposase